MVVGYWSILVDRRKSWIGEFQIHMICWEVKEEIHIVPDSALHHRRDIRLYRCIKLRLFLNSLQ